MHPGHRYGEPNWIGDPSLPHSEDQLATQIQSNESYEELRFASYMANQLRNTITTKAFPISSRPKMSTIIDFAGLTEMVKVIVGETRGKLVTFVVHAAPFMEVCGYARSALSWPFKDEIRGTRIVHLPFEDPTIFELFVKYIYTGLIPETTLREAGIKLYMLAFRLEAPGLCDNLLACPAFNGDPNLFEPAEVTFILQSTAPFDPLRNLCIQHVCQQVANSGYPANSRVAAELCDKYASEILATILGRSHLAPGPTSTDGSAQHILTREANPAPLSSSMQDRQTGTLSAVEAPSFLKPATFESSPKSSTSLTSDNPAVPISFPGPAYGFPFGTWTAAMPTPARTKETSVLNTSRVQTPKASAITSMSAVLFPNRLHSLRPASNRRVPNSRPAATTSAIFGGSAALSDNPWGITSATGKETSNSLNRPAEAFRTPMFNANGAPSSPNASTTTNPSSLPSMVTPSLTAEQNERIIRLMNAGTLEKMTKQPPQSSSDLNQPLQKSPNQGLLAGVLDSIGKSVDIASGAPKTVPTASTTAPVGNGINTKAYSSKPVPGSFE